jgi:hypothetical protein
MLAFLAALVVAAPGGAPAVAPPTAATDAPCPAGTQVVFACTTPTRAVALCAGAPSKAGGPPTSLQFRAGPPGKPDLLAPPQPTADLRSFTVDRGDLHMGQRAELEVVVDGTTYNVWTLDIDAEGGFELRRNHDSVVAETCSGPPQARFALVEDFVTRAKNALPAPGGPPTLTSSGAPDPLAGRSPRDVCQDDALLLIRHPFEALRDGGFRKHCCDTGAMGDDARCELDWPSSDVPSCASVDAMRNRIFAWYGYPFAKPEYQRLFGHELWYRKRDDFNEAWLSPVAKKNVALLKNFKECEKDDQPRP